MVLEPENLGFKIQENIYIIQDGATTHLMSDVKTITPLLEERKNTLGMY